MIMLLRLISVTAPAYPLVSIQSPICNSGRKLRMTPENVLFKVPCKARPIARPTTPAPAKTEVSTLSRFNNPRATKNPISIITTLRTFRVICLIESCRILLRNTRLTIFPMYLAAIIKSINTIIASMKLGKLRIRESSQSAIFPPKPLKDSLKLNSSKNFSLSYFNYSQVYGFRWFSFSRHPASSLFFQVRECRHQ